jgi:hypothetical protein
LWILHWVLALASARWEGGRWTKVHGVPSLPLLQSCSQRCSLDVWTAMLSSLEVGQDPTVSPHFVLQLLPLDLYFTVLLAEPSRDLFSMIFANTVCYRSSCFYFGLSLFLNSGQRRHSRHGSRLDEHTYPDSRPPRLTTALLRIILIMRLNGRIESKTNSCCLRVGSKYDCKFKSLCNDVLSDQALIRPSYHSTLIGTLGH